jgi:hypothetical protein
LALHRIAALLRFCLNPKGYGWAARGELGVLGTLDRAPYMETFNLYYFPLDPPDLLAINALPPHSAAEEAWMSINRL